MLRFGEGGGLIMKGFLVYLDRKIHFERTGIQWTKP